MSQALREGFTTGTAATAASMCAVQCLCLRGELAPLAAISVPLPKMTIVPSDGQQVARLSVPIQSVTYIAGVQPSARAVIIKDGGDDPDATHGIELVATAQYAPAQAVAALRAGVVAHDVFWGLAASRCLVLSDTVVLCAGEGIGQVTLPGLPVQVGEAAINPAPRQQILAGVQEVLRAHSFAPACSGAIAILLSVPEGQKRARQTLNSRLGITGGISILGTAGIVRPYSHDAWKIAILQGMDVAQALGSTTICLSTGRRSERLLMQDFPTLPPAAFVQVADFAAFSLQGAAARNFSRIVWGCFPGKLLKLAQGLAWTHAKTAPADMALLAQLAVEAGATATLAASLQQANTVAYAFALLEAEAADVFTGLVGLLSAKALQVALCFLASASATGACAALELRVYDLNGHTLFVLHS